MSEKYLYALSLEGEDYVINHDEIIDDGLLKKIYLEFLNTYDNRSLRNFTDYLVRNYGFYWAQMDVTVDLSSILQEHIKDTK